jgi:hypothetical protein
MRLGKWGYGMGYKIIDLLNCTSSQEAQECLNMMGFEPDDKKRAWFLFELMSTDAAYPDITAENENAENRILFNLSFELFESKDWYE